MNSVIKGTLLLLGCLGLSLQVFGQTNKSFAEWRDAIIKAETLSEDKAIIRLDELAQAVEQEHPSLFAYAQCAKASQLHSLDQVKEAFTLVQTYLPLLGDQLTDWDQARFQYLIYSYYLLEDLESVDRAELDLFRDHLISIETQDTLLQNKMYWQIGFELVNYECYYGRNAEALSYIYELIELAEADSLHFGQFRYDASYNGGTIYFKLNELEKAMDFFEQSVVSADKLGTEDALDIKARSIHYIGIIHKTQGDTLTWAKYIDKAIEIYEALESENIISAQLDMAEHYILVNQLEKGENYLRRAIDNLEKFQVEEIYLISACYSIEGILESAKGNYATALKLAQKSIEIDEDAQTRLIVLLQIQKYAEALGDYQLAYQSMTEYQALYEAGMNEKQLETVNDLEKKYALAEKERDAAHFLETQALQDKQLSLQRRLLILAFIALAIMIGLSLYLYRLGERLKAANGLLRDQKIALNEAKEEAIAASKAKADFLSVMSHEIRTPMNGVIGMTDILASTRLDKEQVGFVHTISNSADSLLTIINDILDFSKIESGNLEIEQIEFSLNELISEVLSLFSASAYRRKLELIYYVEPNLNDRLIGDPVRLKQILSNLVSNAIKFTAKGEILVTAKIGRASTENGGLSVIFAVKDTGIGIPKEKQNRLFKAFSQADSSTTRKYGGTGLGLAISAKLSQLMGGEIWVESEAKQGATFSFSISTQIANTATDPHLAYRETLSKLKVLVVEDNATQLDALSQQLATYNIQTIGCRDADVAIEQLHQQPDVSLIITDLKMPQKDGLTFYREIQTTFGTDRYPAILLSEVADVPSEKAPFQAIINKPIKALSLIETIYNLIEGVDMSGTTVPEHALNNELAHDYPLSILVAEDNRVNQKLVLRMLSKLGYQVDLAQNGLEAVEMALKKTYDLILMDVQMPELDGITATQNILQKANYTPSIIAMTANALKEDIEQCLAAGMSDHLAKPFRSPQLVSMLKKYSRAIL